MSRSAPRSSIHLQSESDETVNLAILNGRHDTVPESGRGCAGGLLLNFEVDDVDAVHERLTKAGLPILLARMPDESRSEPERVAIPGQIRFLATAEVAP